MESETIHGVMPMLLHSLPENQAISSTLRHDASPSYRPETKRHDTDFSISKGIELEALEVLRTEDSSHDLHASAPLITSDMHVRARLQFSACCYCLFLAGWNDGTTGSLLPRIQKVYDIGFAVVSLLFIMGCIGFVSGATMNVYLTDRLGFGKVLCLGAISQVIGYSLDSPGPPFPLLCLGYVFNGFGIALQNAQATGYVASLKENPRTKMGILHAVYGVGALASPLVATQFAQLPRWSFHFLVSLALAILDALVQAVVFRGRTQDVCLQAIGQSAVEVGSSTDSKYRQIMRQKIVHLLAFWALVYVGVEVTIGGWTVTYVIQQRGGGPSSGYISSGFFGGLTLGRIALLWVNSKIGERRVVFVYALLAMGLEITIWVIPSLIGNAVAVAIVGVFLGPMYPILMNQSALVIPAFLLTGSIGWIAGLGQAGSALLPFLTGTLASRFGIKSLQPFVVALMSVMTITWALITRGQRRKV